MWDISPIGWSSLKAGFTGGQEWFSHLVSVLPGKRWVLSPMPPSRAQATPHPLSPNSHALGPGLVWVSWLWPSAAKVWSVPKWGIWTCAGQTWTQRSRWRCWGGELLGSRRRSGRRSKRQKMKVGEHRVGSGGQNTCWAWAAGVHTVCLCRLYLYWKKTDDDVF